MLAHDSNFPVPDFVVLRGVEREAQTQSCIRGGGAHGFAPALIFPPPPADPHILGDAHILTAKESLLKICLVIIQGFNQPTQSTYKAYQTSKTYPVQLRAKPGHASTAD